MAYVLWDNPVFQREARWWLRGRWLRRYWLIAAILGFCAAVCGWFFIQYLRVQAGWYDDQDEFIEAALRPMWFWLTRSLLLDIFILGPIIAAPSIVKEREMRTWESLALTQLTGRDILFGKWFAAFTPLCFLILVSVPLLLLTGRIFKISLVEQSVTIAFLMITAASSTFLGLFFSFLARKSSVALILSIFATLSLCFGTLLVDAVARQLIAPSLSTFSPFYLHDRGTYDYGFFGLPSLSWLSPFYVLSVFSGWAEGDVINYSYSQDAGNVWSAAPFNVLLSYSVSLVLAISFCLYYMLTRYRRDIRGGRPLGETIS